MTKDEKLKILKDWEISVKAFRQNVGVLSTVLKEEIIDQLYEFEDAKTKMVSMVLGCSYTMLSIYVKDQDFIHNNFEVEIVNADGFKKKIEIKSIEDILKVIEHEH